MITKIRSVQVPTLLGSWDTKWVQILDATMPLQPGMGGYVNVAYGHPLQGNHLLQNTETIVYDQQGRNHPNFCHHTATGKPLWGSLEEMCTGKVGYCPKLGYRFTSTSPWMLDVYHEYTLRWMPNFAGGFAYGWFQTSGPELDDTAHLSRAIADLRAGCLKPVFNLPRAVIELKDMPQTLRGVLAIGGALNDVRKYLARNGGMNFRAHGRQITSDRWSAMQNLVSASKGSLGDIAQAYLTYQFGIRPTTQDLQSFLGLKWHRKQEGRTTELWFEKRHMLYKAGQKLRIPYRLGGKADLPLLSTFHDEETIPLLRDWASDISFETKILNWLNLNAQSQMVKELQGVVFAEVVADKEVNIPHSELLAYSGGFLSTMFEVTPWTWVSDAICDVGKYLQTLERLSLPTEYRPELKFGTWVSKARCASVWVPVFQDIGVNCTAWLPCDPETGYGGSAHIKAHISRPVWKRVLESNLDYTRNKADILDLMSDRLPVKVPGRYMLGPGAALITQFATGNKMTRVRGSSIGQP